MIGKVYKTIDTSGSRLLHQGIIQVTALEPDAVHYTYLSVKGIPHSANRNDYAQELLHFKNYTIELTELEKALL